MSVVSRAEAKLPPLRRKTVQVDEIGGEVILQALTLSDALRIGTMGGSGVSKIPHILAVGVLQADKTPLWTVEEWDQFGSVAGNRMVCMDLSSQIGALSDVEKKVSTARPDSPSVSA